MLRAIGIIKIDIMKRESMLREKEHCLRHKELKLEIKSLKEALSEIELSYSTNKVSKEFEKGWNARFDQLKDCGWIDDKFWEANKYSSDDLIKYNN